MTGLSAERFDCFAPTALGLEPITARELKSRALKPRKEVGGVTFRASLADLYASNLWLRTASRVLVRMDHFHANTFHELERRANKIDWMRFLPNEGSVALRVTTRKSKLYHSDAVAERILAAIAKVAPASLKVISEKSNEEANDGDESGAVASTESTQLFVVRIFHDECEISADSSGELLHRRGYRKDVAKAPLRETLAAAMLLACGWQRTETLLDPLCGSGTIPIEAAMIANNIAPGSRRDFAFMRWPGFDRVTWNGVIEAAKRAERGGGERERDTDPPGSIIGSDRDRGAIEAAQRNADRAGVGHLVAWQEASLSESVSAVASERPGWLLANPPYGLRLGEPSGLRNLYATLGRLTATDPAWRTGILTADRSLAGHTGVPLRERFATRNGGIPVIFFVTPAPTAP